MNAAYSYNPKEACAFINSRIYIQLEKHHWSVKTLSDKTGIPYETLKKLLSMKTENTSFHNIARIALAFNCNLNYLTGASGENDSFYEKAFYKGYLGEIGSSFRTCETPKSPHRIPVFSCDTDYHLQDAKPVTFSASLDLASYPAYLQKEADYGLMISSYCYHPVYYEDDILLVSKKRAPKIGETAVFSHNGKLYIRLLLKRKKQFMLSSVNGLGTDIFISDFSQWRIRGTVVGIHRL